MPSNKFSGNNDMGSSGKDGKGGDDGEGGEGDEAQPVQHLQDCELNGELDCEVDHELG